MPTADRHAQPPEQLGNAEALLRELRTISALLDDRNEVADFTPSALVVTDDQRQMREQRDWPVKGGRRWLVGRSGFGQTFNLQAAAATQLLRPDAGRLGGLISVPSGGAAVTLFLCSLETLGNAGVAVPQIALGAGGQWNFMLGGILWGGSITAQSAAGTPIAVAVV